MLYEVITLPLTVEGNQLCLARNGRATGARPRGQHQLAIGEFAATGDDLARRAIDALHPAVRYQGDALLLGKVGSAQAGHGDGTAALADDMAQVGLVVVIAAVGGEQTDSYNFV